MSQVGPVQVGVNGSTSGAGNLLYYGDNLDILRRYVKDETVDLCYLDPPFNSNADYNVLFSEQDGSRSPAQVKAFKDTWTWDEAAALALWETVNEELPERKQRLRNRATICRIATCSPTSR